MERLTERTPYGICGNNKRVTHYPLYKVAMEDPLDHGITGQCFEKLAEYEDLEEQGLLLRLPCKVGDTVYWLRLQEPSSPTIIPCIVARYATKEDRPSKRYMEEVKLIYNGFSKRHSVSEFNKTLFLTKEQAEAALEKMKGENNA